MVSYYRIFTCLAVRLGMVPDGQLNKQEGTTSWILGIGAAFTFLYTFMIKDVTMSFCAAAPVFIRDELQHAHLRGPAPDL